MIDRYTKAVLTVIAGCFVMVFRTSPPIGPATAQSGPVHVVVDSVNQFAFQFVDLKVHQ